MSVIFYSKTKSTDPGTESRDYARQDQSASHRAYLPLQSSFYAFLQLSIHILVMDEEDLIVDLSSFRV
jgi:hypothetical protein